MATSKEEERRFVVKMYETEYRQIQAWVAKHQHIETGGDLFGLWADEHTAVVQLVLGPGKNCRRTATSFYQDTDYLERVGNVLTSKEGLCHIGEWHSHHRIGLTRPSEGDENTVWTNMDSYGIHRFFLFIATIEGDSSHVAVRCFPFEINTVTKEKERVLEGEIISMQETLQWNPFRLDKEIANALNTGAESVNSMDDLKKLKMSTNTGKHKYSRNARRHEFEPERQKTKTKTKQTKKQRNKKTKKKK